ncbi:MAG: phosphotransferase family protein [Steroidobacteraceae bacterium]
MSPKALVHSIDKDAPSPQWIAALRQQFPTEREVDRLLTRKLERRAGPGFQPPSFEVLVSGLRSLLRAHDIGAFEISDARWLAGGASKVQMAFDLSWQRPGVGHERTPMVLRMEPAESIVETSRQREFELLRAFQGVVPVPPVFWCDPEGEYLPYPALIYGFAQGVTKSSDASSGVSGLGTRLPPRLRPLLAPQFIEHLATIHTHDYRTANLAAFDVPQPGIQCALWGVNWWNRVWEEDADEEEPLLAAAAVWLRRNMPHLDRPVIVHADYRVGNFLFTEPEGRITAWLDWELGRIGDRHQDLAWTTSTAFGHHREEDNVFLVCGLMPEEAFFEAYERASGLTIQRKSLHWYKVYNAYTMAILSLGTGYRIARNRKTHQDVLATWLMGVGYMLQDEIRGLIEESS